MSSPQKSAAKPTDPSWIAGRYRITKALAEGGMGAVYCVHDERTGETLALKRMRRADSSDLLALFEREYRTLASIQHPRIIRVFDYGVDAGEPFYTMELVQGRDLHEIAPVPFTEACRYLRDVATCLALLHTRRLLHRDVTPRNVRVTEDGHCKLLDFGALTSFGIPDRAVGTPPCIPPEALRGAPLDQRADLFSFGALAYFMLTGSHAYRARDLEGLPLVWQKRPAPLSTYVQGIPQGAEALILSLLNLDPGARPSSIAEVVERLNALAKLPPEDASVQRALGESYLVHPQFVGREHELDSLRQSLEALQRGMGSAILIEGATGMGRTRLCSEVALQARLFGLPSVHVDAGMHREQHGTALAILEQLFFAAPAALAEARTHGATLAQLDRSLAERLGLSASAPAAAISGDWRARVQEVLHDVVTAACRNGRLLLVIDNVDEADEASLALVAALQRSTTQLPLVLALSSNDGGQAQASWSLQMLRERCRKIELRALTQRETFELGRSLFGDAPNLARFAEWLHQRTGGRPLHLMELVRRLHDEDEVRYVDGLWLLPAEQPETAAPRAIDELFAQRLTALSPSAYRLAETIAVQRSALSRKRLIELARGEASDPFTLIEELVRNDVLHESVQGLRFSHGALRDVLRSRMPATRSRELHLWCAQEQLTNPDPSQQTVARITAGWHLLEAGDESRGAELLADVAYDWYGVRFAFADLQLAAPALEAALQVYTKQKRSLYERMPLLAALATAGFYENRMWAERYGDDALEAVLQLSGLALATKLQRFLGKTLGLLAGICVAWLRCLATPRRERRYGFHNIIVQLFAVTVTLCGSAAAALDLKGAERPALALRPFWRLPDRLTPAGIAQYCDALKEITRENQAYALQTWKRLIDRFENKRFYMALPDYARALHIGGLWFAIGVFETFRDGRGALLAADRLDATGIKLYRMIASEVRAMYHANRGELTQARRYQDQVELHTIQIGSASQVELWEPAALILVYTTIGDVVEIRRVADRLATLAKSRPWLARYAELSAVALEFCRYLSAGAVSGVAASKDAPAGFVDQADAVIARGKTLLMSSEPRSFIGWGALAGYLARGLNSLGRHAEARELCEQTLSHMGPDDRPFVALFLNLELELAIAHAALGDITTARARLDELLVFHAESDNPLTRGRIHEAYARSASLQADWDAFRHHLEEMRSWYRRAEAPALLAQCEQLAALDPKRSSSPPQVSLLPTGVTTVRGKTASRSTRSSVHTNDVDTVEVATVVVPITHTERKR